MGYRTVREMYLSSDRGKEGCNPPKKAGQVTSVFKATSNGAKYKRAEPAERICGDTCAKQSYHCTRPFGHEGEHEAHYMNGDLCTPGAQWD